MTTRIYPCFYCETLTVKKLYRVPQTGQMACRQCFLRIKEFHKEAKRQGTGELVPILTIPIKFKMVVAGKPIRSKQRRRA
jgi:hypothetical protein